MKKKLMSNENEKTKKIVVVIKKTIEQKIVVVFKSNLKIKTKQFFKSFKFQKFANTFNSTSIKSKFELIIKSNVVFVANSISISISKIEKLNAKKVVVIVQKIMKQKIVVVIETIKFEICVKNIKYFDFIMQINI